MGGSAAHAASRFSKARVSTVRRTSCRLPLSDMPFGGRQASTHPVAQDVDRHSCSTR